MLSQHLALIRVQIRHLVKVNLGFLDQVEIVVVLISNVLERLDVSLPGETDHVLLENVVTSAC